MKSKITQRTRHTVYWIIVLFVTTFNLFISIWFVYSSPYCCGLKFKIPTLLGIQITAASLIFLISSASLAAFGYSKFHDLDAIAEKRADAIAKNTAEERTDSLFKKWVANQDEKKRASPDPEMQMDTGQDMEPEEVRDEQFGSGTNQ